MPLLTEQELGRIEKRAAFEAPSELEAEIKALLASHREQGALIKELAEALEDVLTNGACSCVLRGPCSRCIVAFDEGQAALSKVPR
jgi:hypothetical protein